MARISGINLPKDKRIEAALTLITGIGRSLSKKVLTSVNIDLDKKVKVWGETNTAQEAGWLMDVGKLELLE